MTLVLKNSSKRGAVSHRPLDFDRPYISLREARSYAGMSIKKAAALIGCSESSLRRYENNSGKLPLRLLRSCVNVYKIPRDLLFFGPEEKLHALRAANYQDQPFASVEWLLELMISAGGPSRCDLGNWWRMALTALNPDQIERVDRVFEEISGEGPLPRILAMMKGSFDATVQQNREGKHDEPYANC